MRIQFKSCVCPGNQPLLFAWVQISFLIKNKKPAGKGGVTAVESEDDPNLYHTAVSAIEKKSLYEDLSFPPAFRSLHGGGGKVGGELSGDDKKFFKAADKDSWGQVQWYRASELMKNPLVFEGGVTPNDINQGGLGSDMICSVLAS